MLDVLITFIEQIVKEDSVGCVHVCIDELKLPGGDEGVEEYLGRLRESIGPSCTITISNILDPGQELDKYDCEVCNYHD